MDTHKKIREHISTLSDGALSNSDLELALAALQSADGQQAWNTYHRIGDALRAQATPELSDAFAEKLAARLALEPVPLRKVTRPAPAPEKRPITALSRQQQASSASAVTGDAAPEAVAVSQAKPAVISVS
ncbi:sigma-E factor negative regulatory protein [Massilia sp. TSP1-1-2]|uniref:sigma-E factor negative regulatory protein n=1 Tax=unclassified Massilia TaxID=2609279 RepID=UPI003CFA6AC0